MTLYIRCLLLYKFSSTQQTELNTCKKTKEVFWYANKLTSWNLEFGFRRYRTTDLFVTRIKKIFSKIDKISVLQPATENFFFVIFTAKTNLAKFSKLTITVLTLFCWYYNFIYAKNDTFYKSRIPMCFHTLNNNVQFNRIWFS